MFLSLEELTQLLIGVPEGYKTADSGFFEAVNKAIVPEYRKLGVITNSDADEAPNKNPISKEDQIHCNVPGCLESFEDVAAYQMHYNSVHRYLCAMCKRTLPTPHYLDLHISENHDTYFQARVERGEPMFACFLEECKQLFLTSETRHQHMIEQHRFPSNFRFDKVNAIRRNKEKDLKMVVEVESNPPAAKSTKLKSFTFGHSTERSFNKTCSRKPAALENMNDLVHALEED